MTIVAAAVIRLIDCPLREKVCTHQCPEKDTHLPCRGDVADRREAHRRQHEDVGQRDQHADPDHLSPAGPPTLTNLVPATEGLGCQETRYCEAGPPLLDQGRDAVSSNRLLVAESVRGDQNAGQQPECDGPFRVGGCRLDGSGQGENAQDNEDRPEQGDHGGPLAEHQNGGDRGQNRASAPCDRVDDREVAVLISTLKDEEVDDVDESAGEDEEPSGRAEDRAIDNEHGGGERRQKDRRDGPVEPDQDRTAARPLGQQVPGGVEQSGGEDQTEGGRCHRRSSVPMDSEAVGDGIVAEIVAEWDSVNGSYPPSNRLGQRVEGVSVCT